MPTYYYGEFEAFCESYTVRYIENGYVNSRNWRHRHIEAPYHRLYIVLDGEGIVDLMGQRVSLLPGIAYIIPSYMDFHCDTVGMIEKLFVHFLAAGPMMENIFEGLDRILQLPIDVMDYMDCHRMIESQRLSEYYRVKGIYDRLIYRFIEDYIVDTQPQRELQILPVVIRQIHTYVQNHLSAQLRIGQIAAMVNMTPSSLSKYYREYGQETLKSYIQRSLMLRAQMLLLTTDLSIQEIAFDLGYDDNLYFSRVFKQRTRYAPSHYRQMNRIRRDSIAMYP